ncbi:Hypothetical protein R9X50_00802400 [Acrodontium crateriforme]|uniref:Uncharacterized protein n=1 Tax=Acrodontium crateriforme TaxID=150365 RepID=A0AAQ3MC95_9PEZI|nr:Hypothetical protein R9X50_00802400 [Acrodontium crateriforme]
MLAILLKPRHHIKIFRMHLSCERQWYFSKPVKHILSIWYHGDITESVKSSTSAGFRKASTPRYTHVILLLILGFFFSNVSAAIIPSLSNGIERRAESSTSCRISVDRNYTTTSSSSIEVSAVFNCDNYDDIPFCSFGVPISSPINANNRTINGTSAAESMYDDFFEILQNQTGRQFPAMSSLDMTYEFVVGAGQQFRVNFTPFAWCMSGTVSGCQGVLGDNNATMTIEACGPVFVSDVNGTGGEKGDEAVIQGVIGTVRLG